MVVDCGRRTNTKIGVSERTEGTKWINTHKQNFKLDSKVGANYF